MMLLNLIWMLLLSSASSKIERQKAPIIEKAVCVLFNPFNGISGLITFEKVKEEILINGKITGLRPGIHGFHVHEKGDIRDPKCSTVGEHFNPYGKLHGGPEEKVRHVGDLGNIYADDNGVALFTITDKVIGLEGPNCIIGRALVVHENRDDLGKSKDFDSKVTGHTGEKIVCGVIGFG